MYLITSEKYNKEEISVSECINSQVEFMEEVPEGYNAKNWKIEVEFLDDEYYILKTFGDGKDDLE